MPREGKLTDRQKKFVEIYLTNGRNATDAYIRSARDPSSVTKHKAKMYAHYYTKKPAVKALIDAAEARALQKVEAVMEKYALSRERVAQELLRVAFTNATDVMKWGPDGVIPIDSDKLTDEAKSAVAEVQETVTRAGKTMVRVKNYDKVGALIALGKELGMFKEKEVNQQNLAVQFVIEKS